MARTQTMVQLSEELIMVLDRVAARAGVSRSHVIRDAVEAFVANDREAMIDRQIIDGYTRMPQGGEYDVDEWGNVDKLMAALAVDQLVHLDREEREAGFERW